MPAAGFIAIECVIDHQFAEFHKVRYTVCFFKFRIEITVGSGDENVAVKFFTQFTDQAFRFFQSFRISCHAAIFPHDLSEPAMVIFHGFIPLDVDEFFHPFIYCLFRGHKFIAIGIELWRTDLIGQERTDGIWNHKVAISQSLHQRAGAKTIGTVVGEVAFAERKQTRDVGFQVIIDPKTTHGVMHRGINHHRGLVWIVAGDFLIHFKQVAIEFLHLGFTQTTNRFCIRIMIALIVGF